VGKIFALAEAREGGHAVVDLAVDLDVELVAVIFDSEKRLEIVGAAGTIRGRQIAEHLGGEGIQSRDGNLRTRGIDEAGERVHHSGWQNSRAIAYVWDGVEIVVLLNLAKAFVVCEIEELVFYERSANSQAKLISVQRGFWSRSEEKAGGVQRSVAKKFVDCAV